MPMHASSSPQDCTQTFTDRHIHGIAGVDFATSNVSDIRAALQLLAARRTTSVTASIPTVEVSALAPIFDRLRSLITDGLLEGIHVEGPFIAAEFAGAHPTHAVLSPTSTAGTTFLDTLLEHQSAGSIVHMMTVAPEVAGFAQLIDQLVAHNITPALGHTAATFEQMRDGIDLVHAATGQPVVITHLYNAMRAFHHRDPGPLLAIHDAAAQHKVTVELIADGHHVDMELIKWWFRYHPAAIRLVSDASAATLQPGQLPLTQPPPRLGHRLLDYPLDRTPRLADSTTLASGGKDLLTIHDDLVHEGIDHELVCAAMRTQ